jgi:hypothetical protein
VGEVYTNRAVIRYEFSDWALDGWSGNRASVLGRNWEFIFHNNIQNYSAAHAVSYDIKIDLKK